MKHTLLTTCALLILTASPASPSGIELAWNHCFGQAGAVGMRTSACDANTGNQLLVASFRPPAGPNVFIAVEAYVDYQVSGGTLPCWWNFSSGQLRQNQLVILPVSPSDANGDPAIACGNHYFRDRGGVGGGGMIVTGLDRGQLRGVVAIQTHLAAPIPAEAQQYGIGFRIANGSTVPGTTCPGCAQSACLILNRIRLDSPDQGIVELNSVQFGSENYVRWQSTAAGPCAPTAAAPSTWGSIKSIYR